VSKGFGPLGFKGSTQEPPSHEATARQGNQVSVGWKIAANDPAEAGVPDPLGCEVSVLHLIPNKSLEKLNSLENDFESSKS
jgi:hypothetical protein